MNEITGTNSESMMTADDVERMERVYWLLSGIEIVANAAEVRASVDSDEAAAVIRTLVWAAQAELYTLENAALKFEGGRSYEK